MHQLSTDVALDAFILYSTRPLNKLPIWSAAWRTNCVFASRFEAKISKERMCKRTDRSQSTCQTGMFMSLNWTDRSQSTCQTAMFMSLNWTDRSQSTFQTAMFMSLNWRNMCSTQLISYASIDWTFYNFSVTRIVRMFCAKNYEKLSKFIEVTAKILLVLFFWDTVYICCILT